LNFLKEMSPLVLILSVWLLVFVLFVFPAKKIKLNQAQHPPVNRKLFFLSAFLLILFIFSVELKFEQYFLIIIFILFLFFNKKVILKTDWGLIFLFIFIFIDVNFLCQLKGIKQLLVHLDFNNTQTLLLSGSLLSQIISNVPATILLSNYSPNFKIISYGVNIGGNGLLISSFANLIALRFINSKSKYLIFHFYSLSYFICTLLFVLCFHTVLFHF
ncbi:MAG: citrate transporter, partial [Deltaproteobacteria bacterium]